LFVVYFLHHFQKFYVLFQPQHRLNIGRRTLILNDCYHGGKPKMVDENSILAIMIFMMLWLFLITVWILLHYRIKEVKK
jgi:hypothetical protein